MGIRLLMWIPGGMHIRICKMVKKTSKIVVEKSRTVIVTSNLQKKMDEVGDLVSGYVAKERMENSSMKDFVDSKTAKKILLGLPRGKSVR